ncbi:PQQ-dependent sugar dehydrogenase [Geminicoccus flavidas]|uniref:PQQ-dependent sugar dehydrogenase n=1 Tax=Geminicoccus flavidas TaxID=2506407 RepID=UPI0013572676|nr:sorbosone dehydrogenase family protein [Geminicoccus flavidas]
MARSGSVGSAGLLGLAALALAACTGPEPLPVEAGYGPNPTLPEPRASLVPTVKTAAVIGWTKQATPIPAPGFAAAAFARELEHPRWLYVLPNSDVLVAESNAPPKESSGFRDWVAGLVKASAGAGVKSPDRIILLRDADGDGVAEIRTTFLDNLFSPFGMALIGSDLYVANADAVLRFPYRPGETRITAAGEKIADLPGGPINHHWTKNILASPDGTRLFATVGSNSNVGENGMENEERRAAILEIELATRTVRVFASGLRNPNGLAWQPASGQLWTTVNERDEIGDDLVPDYLTSVRDGGFYGWPYSWYGRHVDVRAQPPRPDLVAQAIVPDYALGAHTASLGLAFYEGDMFPERYRGGAFIGQHGSWNRSVPSGYQVLFVPFDAAGRPDGPPERFLTGFLNEAGQAHGRPVGVAVDRAGALLVADDAGNAVWRVTTAHGTAQVVPAS